MKIASFFNLLRMTLQENSLISNSIDISFGLFLFSLLSLIAKIHYKTVKCTVYTQSANFHDLFINKK